MATTAEIRQWAEAQGIPLRSRGRLPAEALRRYEEAHPDEATADDPPEAGPDFTAAAAGEEALPDPVSPPAAGEDQPPAPPRRDEAGPPPPASLDEAKARRAGKGKPSRPPWAAPSSGKRGQGKRAPEPHTVTRAQLGDIEGKVALLLSIPAALAATIDPVCGGAAADNLDNIVRKTVPIIAQSPAALAWLAKDATFLLWLDLALALQPVGLAIWAHHIAGTVTVVNGRPVAAHRLPSGQVVPDEGAPAPEPEGPPLSAYTVPGHVPPVQRPA